MYTFHGHLDPHAGQPEPLGLHNAPDTTLAFVKAPEAGFDVYLQWTPPTKISLTLS